MQLFQGRVAKPPGKEDILDHAPQLIAGMRFSTQEFYQRVEAALQAKQIPDVEILRVEYKEGGSLSPKREYLRCRREMLFFDICAMPFGSGFYVSGWLWKKPQKIGLAAFLVALTIITIPLIIFTGPRNEVYFWFWRQWGIRPHTTTLILSSIPVVVSIATIVWLGDRLDDFLLRFPFIGFFYERYWRHISFYRVDRICAFRTAVGSALSSTISEICESQGITPKGEFDERPIHDAIGLKTSSRRDHRPPELVG